MSISNAALATALVLCMLASLDGAAAAAQTRSEITGTIADASGGVLPGVAVTVESPSLVGGPQSTVTNADGRFRLNELTPGVYQLTAQLQGFQTIRRTDLRVLFGTTVTVDLTLAVAAVEQLITVSGAAPAVNVRTSAATTTIDNALLQNVPISNDKRLIVNLIELMPGSYSRAAYGAVRDANALMLDGVNISEPQRGGIAASRGLAHNWIEEVQFVSLGASAEYGEFTGTATNFTVRSGANRYSGLVDYWTSPNRWVGDNRGGLSTALQNQFRPLNVLANWDLSTQTGGPIVNERLYFFSGFNYIRRKLIPFGGQQPWDDRWPRAIAKVNWAATQKIRVEGFVTPSSRRSTGGTGFDPLRADRRPETAQVLENPAALWNGRMTAAVDDSTLVEVRHGGLKNVQQLDPTSPNTRLAPAPRTDQLTGITSVNSPSFSVQDSTRNVVAASMTRYLYGVAGTEHALKFGGEYEHTGNRTEAGIPAGRLFLDFNGAPNQVTLFDGSTVEGRGRRAALYAQDNWAVTSRLTIQPGLRITINRGSVPDKGRVFSTSPVSPRLGLAWDVAADHKTVVRAHYGRFHEALLTGMYEFMHTAGQSPRITAAVLGPDSFRELNRFTPQGNFGIDADVRQPRLDQYLVGIEREVLPELSIQMQYVRRRARDIVAFVDTRSRYEPVQRPDPGPDGVLNTTDDAGLITVYNLLNPGEAFRLLTNPPDAFRRYDALQLVGHKRYSRNWQFQGSYTWSRTRGNVNNDIGENAAVGSDTGQTGVFADPNRAINAVGRSQFDFTHQLQLEGTYRMPVWGGVNVSAVYIGASGAAIGRTAVIRGLSQGNVTVRIEPRGRRRTNGIRQLDLRVEKTWPLGPAGRSAGLYFDVLNANNYGTPIIRFSNPVIETSGSTFMRPRTWIDPRIVQAGVRFTF